MNSANKQTVKYQPIEGQRIAVGLRANVFTPNDPRPHLRGASWVHTTEVLEYDELTGAFETKNTKYILDK